MKMAVEKERRGEGVVGGVKEKRKVRRGEKR